ncbi:radical SAM family heme chaperone HemW [Herbiconiux sp. L3-i23]|uniref:radical SAM family heme chaperone HemW n=1 Tax=Herbiconiux sp. L3-i23 TaxID=2905871 RepID=UPI0020476994|nr:radical SAM family heme chaperone HemW [Herbiconiux sp. L3-i23]BDI23077.1 coproporphyrinogen III oxidase [Herbiconiux sp. L3-i23]
MPSALPLADPAPVDGLLPATAAEGSADRALGVYLHVPFCRVRCGYCDFNTYTADELRGAKRADFAGQAAAEVAFAAERLERSGIASRPASTVFFGGGTPTLLPADDLAFMLAAIREHIGIVPGAEVTTEANPDSVDADYLARLRDAGFTRVSFGMQSAVPSVLRTLDRTHDPERIPIVVDLARRVGLDVSVDLIYGTPGESLDDWRRSLEHAIAQAPDHLSAYALIVEDGTKLARQIRSDIVATPDDDLQADMYELADELLTAAGYGWYEVSNWARTTPDGLPDPAHMSRHNLNYWRSADWWGVGPGAHSHVGGVRWWNARHPAAYAERIGRGESPAVGRETLDADTRRVERVLLEVRIREGLSIDALDADARIRVAGLLADGLVDPAAALRGRLVLTLKGRLLADDVVRRIT